MNIITESEISKTYTNLVISFFSIFDKQYVLNSKVKLTLSIKPDLVTGAIIDQNKDFPISSLMNAVFTVLSAKYNSWNGICPLINNSQNKSEVTLEDGIYKLAEWFDLLEILNYSVEPNNLHYIDFFQMELMAKNSLNIVSPPILEYSYYKPIDPLPTITKCVYQECPTYYIGPDDEIFLPFKLTKIMIWTQENIDPSDFVLNFGSNSFVLENIFYEKHDSKYVINMDQFLIHDIKRISYKTTENHLGIFVACFHNTVLQADSEELSILGVK